VKKRLFLFLLPVVFICQLVAQAPQKLAKSYVERAVEQMGGTTRLQGIKTARVEYWGHRFLLEESERPDGPWIATYEKETELRDYQHGNLRRDGEQWGLGTGSDEGLKSSLTVADGIAQMNMGEKHRPMSMEQVIDAQEV